MSEAYVRVLAEVRTILAEMQPTLARLKSDRLPANHPGLHQMGRKNQRKADVENLISMCEALCDLLWFAGKLGLAWLAFSSFVI